MGDLGSLALGGAIACLAVLIKQETAAGHRGRRLRDGGGIGHPAGGLLQDCTGKRIFKMAPLHHHFELSGWKETKVVVRFWIIAVIFAMIGLATLKLR